MTTLIGGTVGGYITYAGAHRLIESGTTGPENLRTISRGSVNGVLVTGVLRIRTTMLLYCAVVTLGIMAVAPAFFGLLYEQRYHGAARFAQIMGIAFFFDTAESSMRHMPLVEDYVSALDSDVADARQVTTTPGHGGGSIVAALFLRPFTGGRRWAHLDIAGTGRADGPEHEVVKGATGYGARLLLEWLESSVAASR